MVSPTVEDALIVNQSVRRQLPTFGGIAAILGVYVLFGVFNVIARWILWLGIAVFGTVLLVGLYGAAKARSSSWEFRLDPNGVTVRGHSTRPWSDFAEIRVTGLRPGWFFFLPFGYRVVSFIGQPGLVLPTLPSAALSGGLGKRSASLQDRWYGTRLIVMPYAFDSSTEMIVDAVRRFSDVPVRR